LSRRIISLGIAGQQGAGKDTVSKMFEELWPEKAAHLRLAFADFIKKEVAALGVDIRAKTPEIRKHLQEYGALQRKLQGDDYWIRQVASQCRGYLLYLVCMNELTIPVIFHHPDVRLRPEFNWIKNRKFFLSGSQEFGFVINVVTSEDIRCQRIKERHPNESLSLTDDITENPAFLKQADFMINNEGTLADLQSQIQVCIQQILQQVNP